MGDTGLSTKALIIVALVFALLVPSADAQVVRLDQETNPDWYIACRDLDSARAMRDRIELFFLGRLQGKPGDNPPNGCADAIMVLMPPLIAEPAIPAIESSDPAKQVRWYWATVKIKNGVNAGRTGRLLVALSNGHIADLVTKKPK